LKPETEHLKLREAAGVIEEEALKGDMEKPAKNLPAKALKFMRKPDTNFERRTLNMELAPAGFVEKGAEVYAKV
jgi:hypothetical protein